LPEHVDIAMSNGTGKTFTLVNQIYRLMKSGVAPNWVSQQTPLAIELPSVA
jgi:hypothetical protein